MTHLTSSPSPTQNQSATAAHKAPLGQFLARNPFAHPLTLGFFYREKMRAIHTIAPDQSFYSLLEVGGGQGGLTARLYPNAQITNLDFNPSYAQAPCNQQPNISFVCGDATQLPFDDESFDAVTMFDVLEHIQDDRKAISEALRVLKPGGFLMVSTPDESVWRFPYYPVFKSICPLEANIMAEWGHVRRGYTLETLKALIPIAFQKHATFINALTVLSHDLAFSSLPPGLRYVLCCVLSPLTWLGYKRHQPTAKGTEIALLWQKPARES